MEYGDCRSQACVWGKEPLGHVTPHRYISKRFVVDFAKRALPSLLVVRLQAKRIAR